MATASIRLKVITHMCQSSTLNDVNTILQGEVCQLLTGGQMLSSGTLITSTSTTDKI